MPNFASADELKWDALNDDVVLRALWLQVLNRVANDPDADEDEKDWDETGYENPPWYGIKKVEYEEFSAFLSSPEAYP